MCEFEKGNCKDCNKIILTVKSLPMDIKIEIKQKENLEVWGTGTSILKFTN